MDLHVHCHNSWNQPLFQLLLIYACPLRSCHDISQHAIHSHSCFSISEHLLLQSQTAVICVVYSPISSSAMLTTAVKTNLKYNLNRYSKLHCVILHNVIFHLTFLIIHFIVLLAFSPYIILIFIILTIIYSYKYILYILLYLVLILLQFYVNVM